MKIAKFFSAIFGVCGIVLMAFTASLCLTNLNTGVTVRQTPAAAAECSESLMAALASGDYHAAQNCLYGRPDLGVDRDPADPAGQAVWEVFSQSLSYSFAGDCYGTETGICRDVTITTLDLSGFTASVHQTAQTLLQQKIQDAEKAADMTLVYDDSWAVHQEVMDEIYRQAVAQAITQQPTTEHSLTLSLVNEEGVWWVLPEEALLSVLSGGM